MSTEFVTQMLPIRVVFGIGTLDHLGDEAAELGLDRVLVIASPSNAAAAQRAVALLGRRCAGRFDDVRQHVPETLVSDAVAAAQQADADGLVTVGGGSTTGLGKAVVHDLGLPLVAVPTTYAGSEMTAIFGVTGEHKRAAHDPRVAPQVVIYDPALTTSLPPSLSALSGGNALAHAVEATWMPQVSPTITHLAAEAVRALADALPRVVAAPDDLAARSDALYGAHVAALVLSWAGVGLHHKLCHVLGGTYGLDHAAAHTVLLPHVTAFVAPAVPDTLAAIARALGTNTAAAGLHRLAQRLGAPTDLRTLGMPEESLDTAAQAAAASGGYAPRPVGVQDLRLLLDDAFAGRTPRSWETAPA